MQFKIVHIEMSWLQMTRVGQAELNPEQPLYRTG